jgi:hypothetical protein
MNRRTRRTRWILVGLVIAILVVLGLGWRTLRCGARKPDSAAQRERDRERLGEQRRRLAAGQAALRDRLRRLHVKHIGVRMVVGRVSTPQGAAIASAEIRVVVRGGEVLMARSGTDGRYGLMGVPVVAQRMEVSAHGYETRVFAPLRLPKAQRVRWDVTLKPAEGVHGVVLHGKEPAPDAIVQILRSGSRRPLGHTRTDLGGRFSLLFDIQAGETLQVTASHAQFGRAQVAITGPGEVTLHLPGGGYVEGRVVDDQGRPVQQFSLSSSSMARVGRGAVTQPFNSTDGRFRLGPLSAERQIVYAIASGYQPTRSLPVVIRSGATVRNVVLTLARSGELIGQVTDASTGQPIRGALVTAVEWGSRTLGKAAGTFSDANGHYTLSSVPGSRTSLRVRATGYQPLLAGGVECSGGERCKRDFALTPLASGQRPGGQLTGVGAVLRKIADGVLIQQLLPGGPAEVVLQKGDIVVMVGDLDVSTVGLKEVAQAIRGETGTDVVLWVRRPGQSEPQRVVITRARVTMPSRRR